MSGQVWTDEHGEWSLHEQDGVLWLKADWRDKPEPPRLSPDGKYVARTWATAWTAMRVTESVEATMRDMIEGRDNIARRGRDMLHRSVRQIEAE